MEQVENTYSARNTYDEKMKNLLIKERRKEKKATGYNKVVVSGNIVEVYRMDYPPRFVEKEESEEEPEEKSSLLEDRTEESRLNNTRRARNTFRRLVLNNFDSHSKFITLTFAEHITDVKTANKEFKKFIQRMRRRYDKFKYASVVEFQKSGRVHYHMISDLPYIENEKLAEIWRNGFVKINDIKHVDNVGAYMVKYMMKDVDDTRLEGLKAYQCSKGLDRPREYKGYEADLIIQAYELDKKEIVFTNSYISEYNGHVAYEEFNLSRL